MKTLLILLLSLFISNIALSQKKTDAVGGQSEISKMGNRKLGNKNENRFDKIILTIIQTQL